MVEFLPKGKNKIVGADSISARGTVPIGQLLGRIWNAPLRDIFFERSVSDAIHLFYYLLSIIFYLN